MPPTKKPPGAAKPAGGGQLSNRPSKSGDVSNRDKKSPSKPAATGKKKVVKKQKVVVKKQKEGAASEEGATIEEVIEEEVEVIEEEEAPEASDAPVAAPAPASTDKKAGSDAAATDRLLALLDKLKAAEQAARAAFGALPRPLSLFSLESLEEQVTEELEGLEPSVISEIVPTIATLLDAGCSDFFGGERGTHGMRVHSAARSALARTDEARSGTAEDIAVAEVNSMTRQVSALTAAGFLACCIQLWVPARDGDAAELERLLDLNPWTVDEPGREGQQCTNALQVACANGHIECVALLLGAGAIFRDADWTPSGASPYVCSRMLANAGYAPQPEGVAAGSDPGARVPRDRYVSIIDMLLDPQTSLANGAADRDVLMQTKETMLQGEPPTEAEIATGSGAPSPASAVEGSLAPEVALTEVTTEPQADAPPTDVSDPPAAPADAPVASEAA